MGISKQPRRVPMRPRAQIAVVDVLEKRLGSLPVIADFSRRLDIAGIIDRACPMRDIAVVSHGQVIEALIANRLTHPQAMVAVADWARDWAVEEVYAIPADALNDRLGRALDAIAPQVEHIVGSIGAAAIDAFGIDVTRLHWDMTSISLYGAYDQVDEDHPAPAYGHPKDRRTDLKQIQAGIAVAADGAIPLLHRAYDGGAGEVAQVVDTMNRLKTQGHEVRVGGSASRHSSRDHVSGWACLGQEAAAGPLRHLHAEAVEGRFAGDAEGAGDVAGWPRVARC